MSTIATRSSARNQHFVPEMVASGPFAMGPTHAKGAAKASYTNTSLLSAESAKQTSKTSKTTSSSADASAATSSRDNTTQEADESMEMVVPSSSSDDEWEEDYETFDDPLSNPPLTLSGKPKGIQVAETAAGDEKKIVLDNPDANIYLFQFPPYFADLLRVSKLDQPRDGDEMVEEEEKAVSLEEALSGVFQHIKKESTPTSAISKVNVNVEEQVKTVGGLIGSMSFEGEEANCIKLNIGSHVFDVSFFFFHSAYKVKSHSFHRILLLGGYSQVTENSTDCSLEQGQK